MSFHCYYKPQPKKQRWVKVLTREDGPEFGTWLTGEEALRHFRSKGYLAELRRERL